MMATIKAEFRKLLTVRSTYIVTALALALVIFFAFYIEGFRAEHAAVLSPHFLADQVTGAINAVAVFGAIIAVLLLTHEYRYNTIMYTLTASNSRSKVLFAKILAVTVYAVIFTVIVAVLSPVMAYLGTQAHGLHLAHQTFSYGHLAWETLFYGWGEAMAGLLIATLTRNQVGTVVALFIVPGIVEQLLSLLLKKDAVYLPFTALSQVVNQNAMGGGSLTPGKAAGVFALYLVGGWVIAWILFLRRDAN